MLLRDAAAMAPGLSAAIFPLALSESVPSQQGLRSVRSYGERSSCPLLWLLFEAARFHSRVERILASSI